MDWDKLKVFHAAAEAGSFTHAGEQLGLSQSAVSRQVSALEQELSVSLFHRHARGLILTEQGELLYRTAHDVFMKLEAARAKHIVSKVAGQADILLVPNIEAGNMLAKQLTFFDGADSAAIVLGAKLPIVLTSRADSVRTRIASCAVAALIAEARRHPAAVAAGD